MDYTILEAVERATGREYMLRQLAEECCELAQAALKLIRAHRDETPMPEGVALGHVIEELADAQVMIDWAYWCLLDDEQGLQCDRIKDAKINRMADRLLGASACGEAWT